MPSLRIIAIDPVKPDQARIAEAAGILKAGGIVVYPTETFYGLGADATNEKAIERVFTIKGRSSANPLPVIIGEENELARLAMDVDEMSRRLIKVFWPGPLTLVFTASPRISAKLTANTGKIGIRISGHSIAASLAGALGRPITATSANPSGAAECTSPEEAMSSLGNLVDAVIDGGMTPGGAGSTILDMTCKPPVIIREGVIPATRLWAVIDAARYT